jgi:lipopolysaccharide export LptBFGC system permease protein LptF
MMQRRSALSLGRIVEWMAKLAPRRHHELMRAMAAELDCITDPSERRRFAVGAVAAFVRLAWSGYGRTTADAVGHLFGVSEPAGVANYGGLSMPELSTRQLLHLHATPFAVVLASLTGVLLAYDVIRHLPALNARGVPAGTIIEVMLLAVPHTLALTIPMSVFIAVSWVFTRPGMHSAYAAAQQERHGVRRLLAPVLIAAAVFATASVVSNTEIVPRANARLAAVLADAPLAPTDRTMTMGELREAARTARADGRPWSAAQAAAYQVEIQKKLSLAVACVVLALAGAAIGLRFRRGGMALVVGASVIIFTGYYVSLMAGEFLADRLVISPFLAMWMANVLLLVIVLPLIWRGRSRAAGEAESLVIGS